MTFEFADLSDVDLIRMRLSYGADNAITQPDLAKACGLPLRRVQTGLEAMKRAGTPIVTGTPGIWLSDDRAEILAAYRRDRARAIGQLVNNRGRLKAVRALDQVEQTQLWGAA